MTAPTRTAMQESLTDSESVAALAERYRMRVADLSGASPQAVKFVPETLARRYGVVPLSVTDTVLDVATANPHDLDAEQALGFALGRLVRMSLASPRHIEARLDELYRPDAVIDSILDQRFGNVADVESVADEPHDGVEFPIGTATGQPIIRLVNRIIAKAIKHRASDVHIEPEEDGVAIRYRIDGVLASDSVVPRGLGPPLVARVKIMARLDIADRLRPQDGRARVSVGADRVDLRVSTLPAAHGEKVVIRILDSRATVLALDGLGLDPDEAVRIRLMLEAREGLILVTGPTGSGKTTLLYSMIRQVQQRGVNIVTVEDPVEYRLPGIVQVQVNEKTGLTFPCALRSILRQDPDVILVGEVRDRETGVIATQAALTGHLVLTTLHTIDAASSITRMTDIGIEPYKVAAALKGIVAQRLLRRLCLYCRAVDDSPIPDHVARHGIIEGAHYRAPGCAECAGTGFRGRLGVTEILVPDSDVTARIGANDTAGGIAAAARRAGMTSLWESALRHVARGTTSMSEVMRVLTPPASTPQMVGGAA